MIYVTNSSVLVDEMPLKVVEYHHQAMSGKLNETKETRQCKKEEEEKDNSETVIQEDTLAVFTYYTKIVLLICGNLMKSFENSKCFQVMFSTAQPAHLVTFLAVVVIGFLMYPNPDLERSEKQSPFLNLIYLGSVSAHFGAQMWMSFVSGLSLYFCLPRHMFGKVQRCLFPKYFLLNSILSLISLSVFLNHNNSKLFLPQVSMQIGALTVCFLIELFVRLYLTPPLLRLMDKTNALEEAAGVGMEVGKHDAGILAKDEHYLKVYKSFRKVHMAIAIGNVITMACSVLHLHYLSNKLYFL